MGCGSDSSEPYRSLLFTGEIQHIVSDVFNIPTNTMSQHTVDPRLSSSPLLASSHYVYSSHPPSSTEQEHTRRPPSRIRYLKSIGIRALALLRSTHTSSSSSVPFAPLRHANMRIIPSSPSSAQTTTRFLPSEKTANILPRYLEAVVTRFRPRTPPESFLNLSDGGVTSPLLSPPEPEPYSFFDDLPKSHSTLSLNQIHTRTILPVIRKTRSQISSLFGKHTSVSDSGFVPELSYHCTQSCNDLTCIEDSCITWRAALQGGTHRPYFSNECLCDSGCGLQRKASDALSSVRTRTVCSILI